MNARQILRLANEVSAVGDETATIKPMTVEAIGTHVYYYANVNTDRTLDLIRQIREIDGMLRSERDNRNLPEDFPQTPIWLHIQSYGGDLFAAFALSDQLQQIQTPICTIVEGICASAATLISMVGTRRYISPNSVMLIHELVSFMWGKHSEFQDEMIIQDALMEQLAAFYLQHSKLKKTQLKKMLKHDTWITAQEALAFNMVDEVLEK